MAQIVFPVARADRFPDRAAMTMENTYDDGTTLSRKPDGRRVIAPTFRGTLLCLSTVRQRVPRTRRISPGDAR
jgi:hypothetical protein